MAFLRIHSKTGRNIFILMMLFACIFFLGWANSLEDIQKKSSEIKSVGARFTQEKHIQILARPLISKGIFYFQAPDSVRWEYISPVKSILLMHKGNIRRYLISGKGAVKDSGNAAQSMQFVLPEISRWTRGQFTDNDYFMASFKGGKEKQVVLTPRKKELSSMISRIVITPSPDTPGVLKSVKIVEGEGNYTLLEFTDVRINEKLNDSLFRAVQ